MKADRVREILDSLRSLKILVVGDLILDRYLYGKVERISPEAPVPILEVEREELRLGGAGNVANNLASLGVRAYLFGTVGRDWAGDRLESLLREKGIKPLLVREDRPTTQKTRVVSMSQQLLRIDRESREPVGNRVVQKLKRFLQEEDFDGVILSDYAKGLITEQVVGVLRESSRFLAVDPRPINKGLYTGANLMTPNEKELRAMCGYSRESVSSLGKRLREELKLDTLVVTLGAKGMKLFTPDSQVKLFPAKARKVYDVTGAGDTVIALLTSFILAGSDWDTACEVGNVAAGIVVGEFGTATASPEQILEEIYGQR
jgi:rfaE bifunctional protein kinase chain/domain